jgi:hypothetical protein
LVKADIQIRVQNVRHVPEADIRFPAWATNLYGIRMRRLCGNNWADRRDDDAFEDLPQLCFSTEEACNVAPEHFRTRDGDDDDFFSSVEA